MPRPGYEAVLLVTGFPSLYAATMIKHVLAAEASTFVYITAEAKHAAAAKALLDALPPDQRGRVELLEASPTAIDLGLSGAEFRAITRELDRIHHIPHVRDATAGKKAAPPVSVVCAAEVIAIAKACSSLRCLVLHSTAAVSGDREGVVYEADLDVGQSFRSPAAEARMRAEKLARRAMEAVPIAVVRPTTIIGKAVSIGAPLNEAATAGSPRLPEVHLLVLLLLAKPKELTIPLPGKTGDVPVHVAPLDYVVRAAHAIGRSARSPGLTFHLADPDPPSARRVIELIAASPAKRSTGRVPSDLAKLLLRTPGIESFVRNPRAFVGELMIPVRYDTSTTESALAGTGIVCPPFASYVDDLVGEVEAFIRASREADINSIELEVDDPLS